jgi:RimJ/RimL family protein N-acetyltransferase
LRCVRPDLFTAAVTELHTERLVLRAADEAEAKRIFAREPADDDRWADGYPFEGDVVALSGFLDATDKHGEQRPFGYYQIVRRDDGNAIGGIGFKGPPRNGTVEIGYGLIPGARGHGYAAEALLALMSIARQHAVAQLVADTDDDNTASQRTLERAGFVRQSGASEDQLVHYAVRL